MSQDEPSPGVERLLGQVPDERLAGHLGVDWRLVRRWRLERGIPVANPTGRVTRHWTPDEVALLGTMPDGELAARLGLKVSSVCNARGGRGIPAYVAVPDEGPGQEAVKLARRAAGQSQRQAAALLGWGQSRWQQIEAGLMRMPAQAWQRYLAALSERQRREVRAQLRVQLLDDLGG